MANPLRKLQAGKAAVSCAVKEEAANTGSGIMRMQENGLMIVLP